jgi:non-canonical (house-cleaning) NTP pyrophosphatase
MTAVKTKDPLTPINIARSSGLPMPAAILNKSIAGIAAARLACPDITGGKLATNSVIFGTKNGLKIEADRTAIIASFLKISLPVPRTFGLNIPLVMVPMIVL